MTTQRRTTILSLALVGIAAAPAFPGAQSSGPARLDKNPKPVPEQQLIAVLQSDAPLFDKVAACRQLAVSGSNKAVPVLAALLGDESLSDYARFAMEPIDGPAVDDALREALGKLQGRLLVGAVNSIGVRRDAKAVSALSKLVRDRNPELAAAALAALGRIATPDAVEALRQALAAGPAELRPAAADACLISADRLLALGKRDAAVQLFEVVQKSDVPKHVQAAAARGANLARQSAGAAPTEIKKAAEAALERSGNTSAPITPKATKAGKAGRVFDGKTFVGWEGNLKWFRIEDGAIVGGTLKESIPQNEFLCQTKEYANFELRLKVRLVDNKGNAGIQFRSRRIPNHHEMIGYQADVAAGCWGSLYDESRRNKFLAGAAPQAVAKVLKPPDWNEYVIRCEGPKIQFWLNGLQTVNYTEADEKIPQAGLIGLQIHSGLASEVWYKDIEIAELP